MHSALLKLVPDSPRWVETRAMLLAGDAQLSGVRMEENGCHFVAVRFGLACIVGTPDPDAVNLALSNVEEVLSPTDYPLRSTAWRSERAVLHELRERTRPELVAGATARFIEPSALDETIPADLRDEILMGAATSPIAATVFNGRLVSFCYGVPTESLWDVSIDTLEGFRGRGFAGLCVELMIDAMAQRGKRPVWGALTSNTASLRLAQKLGFAPVDEIELFTRVGPRG